MRSFCLRSVLGSFALAVATGCSKDAAVRATYIPEMDEKATATPSQQKDTCLSPLKVLAGVQYTCTDGSKRVGTFAGGSLPAWKMGRSVAVPRGRIRQ
jgi:hypothetical protein